MPAKILLIRFSSIGDIILCSPIIRAVKQQLGAEVHFLTKRSFADVLRHNPHFDQLHLLHENFNELIGTLQSEGFTKVIDLHKNLRSKRVIRAIGVPSVSFDKINIEKWLCVNLKINRLPDKHIVDRYFEGLTELGLTNDAKGLELFLGPNVESRYSTLATAYNLPKPYVSIAIGATYFTKRVPNDILIDIISQCPLPCVLIGGPAEKEDGILIAQKSKAINVVGAVSLLESALIIQHSRLLLSPDTGMMHFGAALGTPIISFWGNTIPGFGMYPYMDETDYKIVENKDLSCRPCSKLGHDSCPKGHFKCMKDINISEVIEHIRHFIEK